MNTVLRSWSQTTAHFQQANRQSGANVDNERSYVRCVTAQLELHGSLNLQETELLCNGFMLFIPTREVLNTHFKYVHAVH